MRLYALTIFLSAFLLFQVQPLIGKYILPWFGGGPGVWTTCLLFFQTLLLGGYAYAHFLTTRLRPKHQALVHLLLLGLSLAWLPIIPDASWKPAPGTEPVARILLLLTANLGLPYLVLSATGPLLQRWFSLTAPGVSPYRLYALSNAGSLLALLSFPFVFEPWLSRSALGWTWSGGLGLFVGLCGWCAWQVRKLEPAEPANEPAAPEFDAVAPPRFDQLMWVVLPAAASGLLLATTNKLCLDVAVVPFLWIIPLAVYLVSFILCFDHPRWYARGPFSAVLVAGCGLICQLLIQRSVHLPLQVLIYAGTLFAACMVCHGELYRLRPATRHLTRFYLLVAAGGALGGLLVAVVAPLVLADYYELQIGLVVVLGLVGLICFFRRSRSLAIGTAAGTLLATLAVPAIRAGADGPALEWMLSYARQVRVFYAGYWLETLAGLAIMIVCLREGGRIGTGEWRRRMCAFPLNMTVLLGIIFTLQIHSDQHNVVVRARNFYGAVKVRLYNEGDPAFVFMLLAHGETTHGMQFLRDPLSRRATTYYGATSGVGRVLLHLTGPRQVGLVGLGAGTLAAYGRSGDTFCFYDINPAVVALAQKRFSYLRQTAAKVEIVMGDARLSMEDEVRRKVAQPFDLLVLDAFSSDAIPVHLLTREAMAIYLEHLRPGGVIAVHISNRYLRLRPVVEGLAAYYGLASAAVTDDPPETDWWTYATNWILLSKEPAALASAGIRDVTEAVDESEKQVDWTDDHASLFGILK